MSQLRELLFGAQAALRSCSAGGKVVLVGMGDELMKLDMTHAATNEIDIIGSFRYANTVRPPALLYLPPALLCLPPTPAAARMCATA